LIMLRTNLEFYPHTELPTLTNHDVLVLRRIGGIDNLLHHYESYSL